MSSGEDMRVRYSCSWGGLYIVNASLVCQLRINICTYVGYHAMSVTSMLHIRHNLFQLFSSPEP